MTRPHLIARLIFAAMGVYLLMRLIGVVSSAVVSLSIKCPPESFSTIIFVIAVELIVSLTASLILLFWSNGLTRMIAGPDAGQCEKIAGCWVVAAFRMVACLCGLLILYWPVSQLIASVRVIGSNILSYMTFEGQSSLLSTKTLVKILSEIIKGIFAIYLIFGAPHYVRWQMRAIAAKTRGEK